MATDPVPKNPTMPASQTLRARKRTSTSTSSAEPIVPNPVTFRMALSYQGVSLGWLGMSVGYSADYAVPVTSEKQALILEELPSGGLNYLRIKGSDSYLGVGNYYNDLYFSSWSYAAGLTWSGSQLVFERLPVSNSSGFLYANSGDAYQTLSITRVPVVKPVITNPPLTNLIEHVVVVMLENRSFDNVLGGLYPNKSQIEYRGLNDLPEDKKTNPLDPNDPSQGSVSVFQGDDVYPVWTMPYPDPGELFADMNQQIFGVVSPASASTATMKGFAWNYRQQPGAAICHPKAGGPSVQYPVAQHIMQYYKESVVPMSFWLARHFAVCDSWRAAGPVQTLANRVFAHCGTPGLVPGTNKSRLDNPDFTKSWSMTPPFNPPVNEKTVFEILDDVYPGEINWKVYYQDAPSSALCSYVYKNWNYDGLAGGNVYEFQADFESDIVNNRLVKYSFIEPRYTDFFNDGPVNSSHPGGAGIDMQDPNGSSLPPPISVKDGEQFLSQVYGILAKYPKTFNKTLLIVIYDEHGGLYDHVPPPAAKSPFETPPDNFAYDRYGVRIPAMLINPHIPPGTIYPARDPRAPIETQVFDHTSLISTICAQFGIKDTLTPRSRTAAKLTNLIPANPVDQHRPPPPKFPEPQATVDPLLTVGPLSTVDPLRTANAAQSVVPLNVPAALAVIRAQEHPHALAESLTPLLARAQEARAMRLARPGPDTDDNSDVP